MSGDIVYKLIVDLSTRGSLSKGLDTDLGQARDKLGRFVAMGTSCFISPV